MNNVCKGYRYGFRNSENINLVGEGFNSLLGILGEDYNKMKGKLVFTIFFYCKGETEGVGKRNICFRILFYAILG